MTLAHEAAPARQDTCRAVRHDSLRAEWAAARRRRQRRAALGLPSTDLVDAQPVRDHVRALQAAGMAWKRVAAAAGLHPGTVDHLLYGGGGAPPAARVRPETAAALLAVPIESPAVGTRRRLQALVAVGWTSLALADALGWDARNFHRLLTSDQKVRQATACAVRDLYDRLWDRPPLQDTADQRRAVTRSTARARRNGWPPPLAWDDDSIDDPAARPVVVVQVEGDVVAALVAGEISAADVAMADRVEAVARLTAAGMSSVEIAARLGLHKRSVVRLRGRAS